MSDFEEELVEEIESFDDIRDEVRDLTSEMDLPLRHGMRMAVGPWLPCPILMTSLK